MDITRRKAIAIIVALPFAGTVARLVDPPHQSDPTQGSFYDLISRWHRMPQGPKKERLFRESYRAGVAENVLGALRSPMLERELGLL